MITLRFLFPIGAACLLCGCGESGPKTVGLPEASKQTRSAFSKSEGDVKAAGTQISDALDQSDYSGALGRIESLSVRPDLESEQREALAAARMAVMEKLRTAAASGDKEANEMLEMHRARK